MSKDMKVKAWWLMRVGLLLAVVLGTSAGCTRPAKCDEAGVACADEFNQVVTITPAGDGQKSFDEVVALEFTSPEPAAGTNKDYKIEGECSPMADWDVTVNKGSWAWRFGWLKGDGPVRCEAELSDADASLGTSQKIEVCIDAQGKQQDCKAYAAAPVPDPVKVDDNNAAAVAPKVRCGKLAYKVTDQVYAGGKLPWSDLTWTIRAPTGYDMGKPASSRGFGHVDPSPGPFTSKASDLSEMLSESIITTKLTVSLAAGKATEVRLPIRVALAKLVNTNKTNTDVLRAGWEFKDSASSKEVNIGCSIKQTVLASIVDTALAGKPIGDQTVHILFNAASDKQPVGENGWCYGLTAAGQSPLFKPYRSTKPGELCATYP